MTVRTKTFLIIGTTLSFIIATITLIAGLLMARQAAKSDRRQMKQRVLRAQAAVSYEVSELDSSTADYAGWDDTYAFIQDGNEAYIRSNVTYSTFKQNRFGFMVFVNRTGKIVYSKSFDLESEKEVPVPRGLVGLLTADSPLVRHEDPNSTTSGVWSLPDGPVLLASRPILTSQFTGPIRGALIVGRPVNASSIERISELAQLEFSLLPLGDSRIPNDVRDELLSSSNPQAVVSRPISDRDIVAYGLVRDGSQQPTAVLLIGANREFHTGLRRDLAYILTAVLIVGVAAGGTTLILVNRLILRRLTHLHTFVQSIRSGSDLSARLAISGNDELSELCNAFDGLLGRLQDFLAQRMQAEEALLASEARFRSIVQYASDVMSIHTIDGEFIYVSPSIQRIAGHDPARLIGTKAFKYIHPDDLEFAAKCFQDVINDIDPHVPVEFRFRHANGSWIHVEAIGKNLLNQPGIGGVLLTCRDVTEHKRMLEALRESERRFRDILETVNLAAVMLDTEGRITFCNDHLARLCGWPKDDIVGRCWVDVLIPEKDRDRVKKGFNRYISEGKIPSHHEGHVVTRRGEIRQVVWDSTVLKTPEGNMAGIASIGRDVTDQRRLEDQYRHAQKMEAIGQLAGGVAHDFNNLLQVMLGYVEGALHALVPGQSPHAELQEVVQAISRATILVRQLLTFSRRETMRCENLDLDNVILNMSKMLRRVIGEHITLETVAHGNLPTVYADPNHIEQILVNLALNARDAMTNGGNLRIETTAVFLDEDFERSHPWAQTGHYVLLSVSDTGTGMSPDVLEHVFEPFYTTKEVGKGTGLGLATVYGIVRQHGGLINVESSPGKGTVFRIYLPVRKKEETAAVSPAEEAPPLQGHGETILLAEDDELVRNFTLHVLQDAGYAVLAVGDGEAAIRCYEENADEIDLCILDAVMPKKSGRIVYENIIAQKPDAKILFSSGYSFSVLESDHLPSKGFDLIQKPFSSWKLLRKVHEMLNRRP